MSTLCGLTEVFIPDHLIDTLHKGNKLPIEEIINEYGVCTLESYMYSCNQYILLRGIDDEKKTILTKVTKEKELLKIINTKDIPLCGLSPRDAKQACFVDSIYDKDVLLTAGIGPAGTGKMTLAVAYGLEAQFKENKKLYLCKSTALVGRGKTFGAVPGDVNDKFAPHVASYKIILEKLLGDKSKSYLSMMENKEDINYIPIEYARGMTFENCTFIIDEVQNLTWHELKTICSRMGDRANLIILGDLEQIDSGTESESTGIYNLLSSNSFSQSQITSMIELDQQYRGPIPTLMSDVDKEIKKRIEHAKNERRNPRSSNKVT